MRHHGWLVVASVLGVAAALFAMPVQHAGADITVDHFSEVQDPPNTVSALPAGWSFSGSATSWTLKATTNTGTGSVLETGLGSVLGGSRYSEMTVTAIPGGGVPEARFGVDTNTGIPATPHYAFLFLDSNVDAHVVFIYDANGAGLNQDLSDASSIDLKFDTTDLGVDFVVTLGSGNGQFASSPVQNLAGPGTISIPISVFTTANPLLQLFDIDSIRLAIDTPVAGDFTLDSAIIIRFIPEPGSVLIWSLLGVAGVFYGRRRWMS